MSENLRIVAKVLFQGAIWVFVLSIKVKDQTLFQHANNVLVQNQIVAAIEHEGSSLIHHIARSAKDAFRQFTADKLDSGAKG